MSILFSLGAVSLTCHLAAGLDLAIGNRTIRCLRDFTPALPHDPSRVSIVVAARNEERNLS